MSPPGIKNLYLSLFKKNCMISYFFLDNFYKTKVLYISLPRIKNLCISTEPLFLIDVVYKTIVLYILLPWIKNLYLSP